MQQRIQKRRFGSEVDAQDRNPCLVVSGPRSVACLQKSHHQRQNTILAISHQWSQPQYYLTFTNNSRLQCLKWRELTPILAPMLPHACAAKISVHPTKDFSSLNMAELSPKIRQPNRLDFWPSFALRRPSPWPYHDDRFKCPA